MLQSLRSQRADGPACFIQTPSRQFAGALQMLVGFLTPATCDRVLCRFQLHNYASETLREGVVNVSCHSISFFQNGGLPALLGEFIELNCQHRLVRERLR